MAKNWDYAQMSHNASLAGGPEKWLELIKSEEFSKGLAEGINNMKGKIAPYMIVATGIGAVGTLLIQKVYKLAVTRKNKKDLSAKCAAEAEALLISSLQNECEGTELEEDIVSPVD